MAIYALEWYTPGMQSPKDPGRDRVETVLSMRVSDARDLLRFSDFIADFSSDELIRLAHELPRYGGESLERGLVISGARR
jgi:hypothetical protein